MLGFVFGTACLVGLFATLRNDGRSCGFGGRGARFGAPFGYPGCRRDRWRGGPWGDPGGRFDAWSEDGGDEGFGGPPWARGRGGKLAALRGLLRALDATPAQEKVLREALFALMGKLKDLRRTLNASRKGFARAVKGEALDEVALGEASAHVDEATEAAKKAWIDALAQIHGVLDEQQRATVARWLEGEGVFRGGGFGGPFRGW